MHVVYAFCPKTGCEYVTYDENVRIERMGAEKLIGIPPCLSLWERWPSAARTERANKLILSFKKAVCPTGSGVLVFPSQSPAVTALPEGEPRACTSLHSKLT